MIFVKHWHSCVIKLYCKLDKYLEVVKRKVGMFTLLAFSVGRLSGFAIEKLSLHYELRHAI